jgi:hypothetical protein
LRQSPWQAGDPREVAALLVDGASEVVQGVNLGIAKREHEAVLLRRGLNVAGVLFDHGAHGVGLLVGPMQAGRLVGKLQRAQKLAVMHFAKDALLLLILDALHLFQDRRAVRQAQSLEHAAALNRP